VAWLENNGLLAQPVRAAVGALNGHTQAGAAAGEAYTEEEEAAVSQRLEDLGYL
jgi:hypothetical protein